jgi:hypothetical protein
MSSAASGKPVLHHTGAIAGGAVGSALSVLAFGALFLWIRQRRRRRGRAVAHVEPYIEPYIEPHIEPPVEPIVEPLVVSAFGNDVKRARHIVNSVSGGLIRASSGPRDASSSSGEERRSMTTVGGGVETMRRLVALLEERMLAPEREGSGHEAPPTYEDVARGQGR